MIVPWSKQAACRHAAAAVSQNAKVGVAHGFGAVAGLKDPVDVGTQQLLSLYEPSRRVGS
jgi:hypothetical protein